MLTHAMHVVAIRNRLVSGVSRCLAGDKPRISALHQVNDVRHPRVPTDTGRLARIIIRPNSCSNSVEALLVGTIVEAMGEHLEILDPSCRREE